MRVRFLWNHRGTETQRTKRTSTISRRSREGGNLEPVGCRSIEIPAFAGMTIKKEWSGLSSGEWPGAAVSVSLW